MASPAMQWINRMRGKQEPLFYRVPSLFDQVSYLSPADVRRRRTHLASRWYFNLTIGFMIVVNAMVFGIELDNQVGPKLEDRFGYFLVDFFFLVVFFGEMLLRQNQQGWDYFLDEWNIFDFFLVVLNCLDIVLAVTSVQSARIATTLRLVRLMRISRSIEGARMFYGMWLVVTGLVSSLRTMVWTGVLLAVVVYSLGVALATLVGQEPMVFDRWQAADQYFGSVFRSTITVVQVWTFDDWTSGFLRPMIDHGNPAGVVILALGIVLCNFGIMNIVIGLMVERLTAMKREQDLKHGKFLRKIEEELLQRLGDDFRAADRDASGELDYKEFSGLLKEKSVAFKLRLLGIYGEEARSIFHLLDADRSGTLTPEEFIDGLQRIRGPARSKDVCALIAFAQRQSNAARCNVDRTRKLIEMTDMIQARLDGCGRFLSHECEDRKATKQRTVDVFRGARARKKVIDELDRDRGTSFPSLKEEDVLLPWDTPDFGDGRYL